MTAAKDGGSDPRASIRLRDLGPDDHRWDETFPVLCQLRPDLDRPSFDAVHAAGAAQGLRFTAAFDRMGRCLGVAGWRIADTTNVIRKLYVDDLVVDEATRSTGVGAALLAHLEERGRAAGCRVLDLDSGHQRTDAHHFYRREGFEDRSAHFAKDL